MCSSPSNASQCKPPGLLNSVNCNENAVQLWSNIYWPFNDAMSEFVFYTLTFSPPAMFLILTLPLASFLLLLSCENDPGNHGVSPRWGLLQWGVGGGSMRWNVYVWLVGVMWKSSNPTHSEESRPNQYFRFSSPLVVSQVQKVSTGGWSEGVHPCNPKLASINVGFFNIMGTWDGISSIICSY